MLHSRGVNDGRPANQKGSPGLPNPTCTGGYSVQSIPVNYQDISATGTDVIVAGASTIAAVNSVLGGTGLALLIAHVSRAGEAVTAAIGVAAAAVLFGLHLSYERLRSGRVAAR